jgi:hypothetical protein
MATKAVKGADIIKPVERVLTLADGTPRKLIRDFNALATLEECVGGFDNGKQPGNMKMLVAWAYALTTTHREDTGEALSFNEFKRLMPADQAGIERVLQRVSAMVDNQEEAPRGNAPATQEEATTE